MFKSSSKFGKFKGKRKGNIWQLFRATDFESLMYPCLTFCRILGIFPYKINGLNIKTCNLCYILSIIIACVCCIGILSIFCIKLDGTEVYNTEKVPRLLHELSSFITSSLIAKKLKLKLFSRLPSESYQNLSKLFHTNDICWPVYNIVTTLMICNIFSFSILTKIIGTYISFLTFQIGILYINSFFVLKACFKQINDNLIDIVEPVTNGEPNIFRRYRYNQRSLLVLKELKALQKQHLAISDTVQVLNTVFGLQLLFTLFATFTGLTFTLYFMVMRWIGKLALY
jgi:hypothetical protein